MRKIKVIALIVVILFGSFLFSKVSDPDEVVPVLPPWDIEAVSDPSFLDVPWPSGDPVVGMEVDNISRAYPLSILEWHGVLNDRISDLSVAVTYSFLSDSAVAYDRALDGRVLTFEVHRGVYKNGLLLRDKQTQSMWSQMDGKAIMGPLQGRTLTRIPTVRTSWSDWEALHPATRVLSPPSERVYGIHPYGDYRDSDAILFPYRYRDSSLGAKDLVLGVDLNGSHAAYPLSGISNERVVMDSVGSEAIVVAYAYGAAFIYLAHDRSFTHISDSTMEDQNAIRWNMTTGRSEDGSLSLESLQGNSTVCYWFAWLNVHPKTSLYGFESRNLTERHWTAAALPVTIGLLLCLLVVSFERYSSGRAKDASRPLKWIAYKRSIILAALAILAFLIVTFDSLGNLQIGNTALEALFAVLFLLLGAAMVLEWYHLRGYVGTMIPIDLSEFKENLKQVCAIQEVEIEEREAKKLGFVATEGGYGLTGPDAEMLFSGSWLLAGSPEGLTVQDVTRTKRVAEMSLTVPEEEELA